MYVSFNRDRWLNITIAGLLFLIVIALIKYNSYLLALIDTSIQSKLTTSHAGVFSHVFSALSNPVVCGIYAVIIWFLLWGFKHKLIATWALATYFVGQLVFMIIAKWVSRTRPAGHSSKLVSSGFPSHHLFAIMLICFIIWVAVFPWITKNWQKWLIMFLMILICLIVMVARIKMFENYPFDMVGSILLCYIWGQFSEWSYLKWFGTLGRSRIFRNSDYN